MSLPRVGAVSWLNNFNDRREYCNSPLAASQLYFYSFDNDFCKDFAFKEKFYLFRPMRVEQPVDQPMREERLQKSAV